VHWKGREGKGREGREGLGSPPWNRRSH